MTESPVRTFRRAFDEKLSVAGLACSVALGAALNLVDWADPGEAVLVALTGATLTFVAGAGLRAERRAELSAIMEAAAPVRSEMERALALAGTVLDRYPRREPSTELQSISRHFVAELEELAEGRIRTAGEDRGRLIRNTERCRRQMLAVTNIAAFGPDWWLSPVGRAYWSANEEAIARGVRITRVFVVADATNPEFRALRKEQASKHVRTLVLDRAAAHREMLVNLVIWDEKVAWEAEMDPHGKIRSQVFHHDPRAVGRLLALAESGRSAAIE